ncbi:PhnA domain-containing protein [Planktotalea sp.]|uniref:PhnA domain-containing protein n=1 Tax=Planktotalea sp. TaxID=2029877 RepID=UPI003D6C52C2
MNCALCSTPSKVSEVALEGASLLAPLCDTCEAGLLPPVEDAPHWQCLHEAIWSPDGATQVAAYRVLAHLNHAPWARDLMDIAYLEPDLLSAARNVPEPDLVHLDSNGAVLAAGDTVVLIKDLPVKGAGFTAKRGTAVRNIWRLYI